MNHKATKFLASVLFVVYLVAAIAVNAEETKQYWASKKNDKFHYSTCSFVMKIKPKNRITFKTAQEAKEAGYTACKRCRPK